MATGTLEGSTIASTYKSLLKVKGGANTILDGDPQLIEDGDGNDSVLGLSTDSVLISGSATRLEFNTDGSGEYLSGDGNDLTIASGRDILLAATNQVVLGSGIELEFGGAGSGEYISGDGTDLTITSGNDIVLSPTGNVGIGTAAPPGLLSLEDGYLNILQTNNTSAEANHIVFSRGSGGGVIATVNTTGDASNGVASLLVKIGGTERMTIDANSRISLSNNDSGADNTVFGFLAGASLVSGGDDNTLIGDYAGNAIAGGDNNTVVGSGAGLLISTGIGNTTIGNESGNALTDGNYNVFVGHDSGGSPDSCDYVVAIGQSTLGDGNATQDGTVAIGREALKKLTTGARNLAIGYQSMAAATLAVNNTAIGYQSLSAMVGNDGNNAGAYNTAIGTYAMKSVNAGTHGDARSDSNIAIGYNALLGGTFGSDSKVLTGNIAIGHGALDATSTNAHTGTIAIGHQALTALTSGAGNIAIGYQSLYAQTDGARNVSIGYQSLAAADSDEDSNTAVGYQALSSLNNAGADENTCIGNIAGNNLVSGSDNVIIGSEADGGTTSAINQIAIGKAAIGQADNSVTLGNANVTDVYMASDSGAVVHCSRVETDGVRFPDTQSASADANQLDDYEEGTWNPTWVTSGDASAVFTYQSDTGAYYTKIGRMVYISGSIRTDTITANTDSGYLSIGSLPFTTGARTDGDNADDVINCISGGNWDANNFPEIGQINRESTTFALYYSTGTGASVTSSEFEDLHISGYCRTYFSGHYRV